jgi:hypothetical protein
MTSGKGTEELKRLRKNKRDSFVREAPLVEVDLWDYMMRLRVGSIDGERTWSELGFWACERNSRGKRGCDGFRVLLAARTTSYRHWRVAASILA